MYIVNGIWLKMLMHLNRNLIRRTSFWVINSYALRIIVQDNWFWNLRWDKFIMIWYITNLYHHRTFFEYSKKRGSNEHSWRITLYVIDGKGLSACGRYLYYGGCIVYSNISIWICLCRYYNIIWYNILYA